MEQADTAAVVLETFRETLEQMGIAPSGTDPVSGEPQYELADVARALGIAKTDLDIALSGAKWQTEGGEKP